MKKGFLLVVLVLCTIYIVGAVPADPQPIQIIQPDGSKFSARIKGDEFGAIIETTEGYAIQQGSDNWWYYTQAGKKWLNNHNNPKTPPTPFSILSRSRVGKINPTNADGLVKNALPLQSNIRRGPVKKTPVGLVIDEKAMVYSEGGQSGKHLSPKIGTEEIVVLLIEFGDDSTAWTPTLSGQGSYTRSNLTISVSLTNITNATLKYDTRYGIEYGWDFGYVMISIDNGSTWQLLNTSSMSSFRDASAYVGVNGAMAYTGYNHSWITEEINLTPFVGNDVLIRFSYYGDMFVSSFGWFIDNINISQIDFFDNADNILENYSNISWHLYNGSAAASSFSAVHNQSYYEWLIFNTTNSGSMWNYYNETSYGQLNVTGIVTTIQKSFQPMVYYGKDGSGLLGIDEYFTEVYELTREAVLLADNEINFSQYDLNADGTVDHVLVVHAGGGQESGGGDNIWSHAWSISGKQLVDGVNISSYTMLGETSPVGTFAHEFGHDLGLPDLYDTGYDSEGIGDWGIMASGSWNNGGASPAHFCAWSKYFLGWVNISQLNQTTINYSLEQVETNNTIAMALSNGEDTPGNLDWVGSGEYFLVENRQKVGFDTYIPGAGILIWHIDESRSNNNDQTRYLVALEESDGDEDLANDANQGETTDPWFSSLLGFSIATTPNSGLYNGTASLVTLTNFGNSSSTMYFDVYDTLAPVLTFGSPTPENNSNTTNHNLTFNITSNEPLLSAILEINNSNYSMGGSNTDWYLTRSISGIGLFGFRVIGNDSANNQNITETRYVTLINNAPNITMYSPSALLVNISENQTLVFNQSSEDADDNSLYYYWIVDGIINSTTVNFSYFADFYSNGTHNISLIVTDLSENVSINWTVIINNTEQAPIVLSVRILPTHPNTTTNLICNYTYLDTDEDNIIASNYSWYSDGNITNHTNATLYSSFTTKNQNWSCAVMIFDNTSWSNTTISAQQAIANSPPSQSTALLAQSWYSDETKVNGFDLDSYFYDSDGDTISYSFDGNSTISIFVNIDNTVNFTQQGSWTGTDYVVFIADDSTDSTISNNLSLTVSTRPTTPSSGGGGSGGGGSAAAPSISSKDKFTMIFPTVSAGEILTITPKLSEVPISETEFKSTIAGKDIKIVMEKNEDTTLPPTNYRYYTGFAITTTIEDVERVSWKFSVDKQWFLNNGLDPVQVYIERLRGAYWEKYHATLVSEDQSEYQYEATSKGFSIFAITAEELPKKQLVIVPQNQNKTLINHTIQNLSDKTVDSDKTVEKEPLAEKPNPIVEPPSPIVEPLIDYKKDMLVALIIALAGAMISLMIIFLNPLNHHLLQLHHQKKSATKNPKKSLHHSIMELYHKAAQHKLLSEWHLKKANNHRICADIHLRSASKHQDPDKIAKHTKKHMAHKNKAQHHYNKAQNHREFHKKTVEEKIILLYKKNKGAKISSDDILKLQEFIFSELIKGTSKRKIKKMLIDTGWDKEVIMELIKVYHI